jgi:hypothetical protein
MCEKLRQEFDTVAKETIAYRQRNLPRSRKKLNRQPKQKNWQPQIIYEIFVEFTVSNIIMRDGALLRRFVDSRDQTRWNQLIAQPEYRSELIRLAHTGLTGGHLGLKKTLIQVQRRAYWLDWRADVTRYRRQCSECSAYHRGPPPRNAPLQNMVVGEPFERVGIDLTGPHLKSKNGYTYTLTYLDHFSKWAEATPLRNKETTTVANALVDEIFTRVGVPLQILSNQGK